MSVTTDLADACQELAEKLDEEQASDNYEGAEAITLGKLSANLSSQASTLRTFAISEVITQSQTAMNALNDGTSAAVKASTNLKEAGKDIQMVGFVLSLGAAVISGNPNSVIAAGKALVAAA